MTKYILPSSNRTSEFENITINKNTHNLKEKIFSNELKHNINCFLSYNDDDLSKINSDEYLVKLQTNDIKKIQKHDFLKIETESIDAFFVKKESKAYSLLNIEDNLNKLYSTQDIDNAFYEIINDLNKNNEIDEIIKDNIGNNIKEIALKNNNGEYEINKNIKYGIIESFKKIILNNNINDINIKVLKENINNSINDFLNNNNTLSKEFKETFDYENNYSMIKTISFSETKNDGFNSELNYINTSLFLDDINNNKYKNILFAKYDECIITDDKSIPFVFHGKTLEKAKKLKEDPDIIIFTNNGEKPDKINDNSIKILFNKKSSIFNKIKNKLINNNKYRKNFITKFFNKPSYESKKENIINERINNSFNKYGGKLIKNIKKCFSKEIKGEEHKIWKDFVNNCDQYKRDKILFSTQNNYFDLIDSDIHIELNKFLIYKFNIEKENITTSPFKKEFINNDDIYYSVNINDDKIDIVKKYEKIKNMGLERGFSDVELKINEIENMKNLKSIFSLEQEDGSIKIMVKENSPDEKIVNKIIKSNNEFSNQIISDFNNKRDELIFIRNDIFYRNMINDHFNNKINNDIVKEIVLYNKEKFIDFSNVDKNPDSSFLYPEKNDLENIIIKTIKDLNLNIKTINMEKEEKIKNEQIENYINTVGKDVLISNFKKGFKVKRFEMDDINKTMKEILKSSELREEIRKISIDKIEKHSNIPNENINNIFNILKDKFKNKEYVRVNNKSPTLS